MHDDSDAIKGKQEQHLQGNQFSCLLSSEFLIIYSEKITSNRTISAILMH